MWRLALLLAGVCAQVSAAWRFASVAGAGRTLRQASAAVVLGASLAAAGPALADALPVVGSAAPDFTLPSNRGAPISLAAQKGRWTVLYTYPGDFTTSCTIESQSFEKDFIKYKELGVDIIGLSVDSVEKHLDFAKTYGLDFPLVSDAGGVVSNKYGSLLDIPFMGKFSNRQTYIIGPDLTVKAVFTDVEGKVSSHSQEVLKKVESLIKG